MTCPDSLSVPALQAIPEGAIVKRAQLNSVSVMRLPLFVNSPILTLKSPEGSVNRNEAESLFALRLGVEISSAVIEIRVSAAHGAARLKKMTPETNWNTELDIGYLVRKYARREIAIAAIANHVYDHRIIDFRRNLEGDGQATTR